MRACVCVAGLRRGEDAGQGGGGSRSEKPLCTSEVLPGKRGGGGRKKPLTEREARSPRSLSEAVGAASRELAGGSL